MRPTIIASLLLIAACMRSERNIYGGPVGQEVTGNEVSVAISNVWNQKDAFPLAEKHCRQFGRAARFNQMRGYIATFDCVEVK